MAALIAVQLSFGGFHVVAKVLLTDLHPLTLATLRILGATPLLFWIAWRHDRFVPRASVWKHLVLLGFLGVFLNQILFITGLQLTTATNAAILMPSIPVFAVGVAALLRIEPIGWRRLVGITLAVLGSLVVLQPGRFQIGSSTSVGNLLILINCLSFATFLVLQRRVLEEVPWRTLIAWSFGFGSLGILAVGARSISRFDPTGLSFGTWTGIAYIVLLPTVLGYSLNTWAVKRSTPSIVAAFTTLQPVFAIALAKVFLNEGFSGNQVWGLVLIVVGLLRVSFRPNGPPPRRLPAKP